MRDPSDPPVCFLVVPAKAGTHNHEPSLFCTKATAALRPLLLLRSMGPGFRRDDGKNYCNTSNSPAAPMPPPTHMVTTAYFALRRRPSISAWPVKRAPDMP